MASAPITVTMSPAVVPEVPSISKAELTPLAAISPNGNGSLAVSRLS